MFWLGLWGQVDMHTWVPDFSVSLFIGELRGCLVSAHFHHEEHYESFISPAPLYTIPNTVSSVCRKTRGRDEERFLVERQETKGQELASDVETGKKNAKAGADPVLHHFLQMSKLSQKYECTTYFHNFILS